MRTLYPTANSSERQDCCRAFSGYDAERSASRLHLAVFVGPRPVRAGLLTMGSHSAFAHDPLVAFNSARPGKSYLSQNDNRVRQKTRERKAEMCCVISQDTGLMYLRRSPRESNSPAAQSVADNTCQHIVPNAQVRQHARRVRKVRRAKHFYYFPSAVPSESESQTVSADPKARKFSAEFRFRPNND